MRTIRISDSTISAFSGAGHPLSFKKTLGTAQLLEKLGPGVIEFRQLGSEKADLLCLKALTDIVKKSVLCVPAAPGADNAEAVWDVLKNAAHPRLQVRMPVSVVQMEYGYHLKPSAMKELIVRTTGICRSFAEEVEFWAEDASRADRTFLKDVILSAVEAGASVITIDDSAGEMLPDEFGKLFAEIREDCLPAFGDKAVSFGAACSDRLHLAAACAVSAVRAGAEEIKTNLAGDGSLASLEDMVRILSEQGQAAGAGTAADALKLSIYSRQITELCGRESGRTNPFENEVRAAEDEVTLSAGETLETIRDRVGKLGYDLPEEDILKIFEDFTRIASKKEQVGTKELEAIIASAAMQVPPTYVVDSYSINTGSQITSMAHIKLKKGDRMLDGVSMGDGPIDAAFLAIEQILGHHFELDDFQIQAVTEGKNAMGETLVKIRSGGKLYGGRGISTDIVGASIHAYINAVNKVIYEEETV